MFDVFASDWLTVIELRFVRDLDNVSLPVMFDGWFIDRELWNQLCPFPKLIEWIEDTIYDLV